MVTLISFFVVCVAIGALAQVWKGRTGALWAFLTLIVQGVAYAFVALAANMHAIRDADFAATEPLILDLTKNLLSGGPAFLLMALIVATLPKRRTMAAGPNV